MNCIGILILFIKIFGSKFGEILTKYVIIWSKIVYYDVGYLNLGFVRVIAT